MSRRSKGARLYLKERKGREPVYVIRDGTREISTSCGAENVAGANQALADYLAETFRPDTRKRDLAQVNCAEVLAMYARDLAPDSPSRATIGYHIKALVPYWGDKSLADVKGSTCRKYVSLRSGSTSSPNSTKMGMSGYAPNGLSMQMRSSVKSSTARQELKTFQAAINHWHRESPLAAVPKVTLPEPGSRRERVLERSEVAAMLQACRRLSRQGHKAANGAVQKVDYSYVARFIIIGIYTGTRHDALLGLRWTAALSGGHADIERGVLFRRGSAERETSKRRPPVRISQRLLAHMERWRRADEKDVQHVIHYNGGRVLKMKRAWATVVKAAGLGPDVTPHVLRHTCASWLLWEGRSIWDVAGIIGADASTIERVYGHHRQIEQRQEKRA
jgi:integrase